jgi:hypothetical protein
MAAAVIARRIAALPPHERGNLTEHSGSFYTSKPHEEQQAEELEKEFYEEEFDPVRYMLQDIPEHEVKQSFFDHKVGQRLLQLEEITEKLSKQVMEHHEEMGNLYLAHYQTRFTSCHIVKTAQIPCVFCTMQFTCLGIITWVGFRLSDC